MSETRGDKYQGDIVLGQRIHSILYGGRDGIVIAIHGTPDPGSVRHFAGGAGCFGGRATYDIAFENHISNAIPECILRGVQWFIRDEIATAFDMVELIAQAKKAESDKMKAHQEAAKVRAAEVAALPGKYPYLKPAGKYASAVEGAANLRIELKRAFPGIKFSVRSDHNSINIQWTDGPTEAQVKEISRKYQEGHFNGMEDIYESSNAAFPEVFGGAQYVFENRSESIGLISRFMAELGIKEPPEFYTHGTLDMDTTRMIRSRISEISLS